MPWLTLALAYAGFLGIALAMPRHGKQIWDRPPPPTRRRILALLGWLALAASPFPAIDRWGAAFGSAAWVGLLTAGAGSLVLLLSLVPRPALPAALALPGAGAVILFLISPFV